MLEGPVVNFFRLLVTEIMTNNYFFQGPETSRIPLHNLTEFKKVIV